VHISPFFRKEAREALHFTVTPHRRPSVRRDLCKIVSRSCAPASSRPRAASKTGNARFRRPGNKADAQIEPFHRWPSTASPACRGAGRARRRASRRLSAPVRLVTGRRMREERRGGDGAPSRDVYRRVHIHAASSTALYLDTALLIKLDAPQHRALASRAADRVHGVSCPLYSR
jgi:hypothetical protein